jgi:hypothetical protein
MGRKQDERGGRKRARAHAYGTRARMLPMREAHVNHQPN